MGGSPQQTQTPVVVPPPVDTLDNLRSRDKFEVLLGLCHGPIKGPVNNSFKNITLNDTAFLAADGTKNFSDCEIEFYPGYTPGESIRTMLGGFEDWRGYNVALSENVPVSFATQSSSTRQIILRFKVKKLYQQVRNNTFGFEADGTGPNTLRLEISYLPAGGGSYRYPFVGDFLITGRTLVDQVHEVRIPIATTDTGPYTIQIIPRTANLTSAPCEVELEGYYEVEEGKYGLTKSNTVGVTLATNIPVIRTSQAPPKRKDGGYGIDMIDIRFVVQQLLEQRDPSGTPGEPGYDPGGTFEDEIQILIEVRRNGFPDVFRSPFNGPVTLRGKTTSPVVFEFRVLVPTVEDRWDVRVTRVSGEVASRLRVVQWESYQEVVGGPVRFDGIACLAVRGRATAAFSSYPEIAGEYDFKLVKLPTNYDPIARTYAGTWDGTFKIDWSNNPVWCLYDLAMDDIYGARRFWPELDLDRSDCYEAAQWCDELVPDGVGGWQPRYTFNAEISEARGIREQLRYMAGVFNGIIVDDLNGRLRVLVDKEETASAVFGPENVLDGTFSYAYTDPDTRYNDVTVKFSNATREYELDSRNIFDPIHQGEFGIIPYEFAALGCTNSHEAVRRAAYKMITATTETESVSFQTNRRGCFVQPFDVILVADPDKGHGLSGRIGGVDSSRYILQLMEPLYLEQGVGYSLHVDCRSGVRVIPIVSTVSSYTYSLQLGEPLPTDAPEFAFFTLGSGLVTSGVPKPFRVLRVTEEGGDFDKITIEGLEINRNKWLLADAAIDRAGIDFVGFGASIAPVTNLNVITETVLVNAEPRALAVVSWTPSTDPRVNTVIVQYRRAGMETWIEAGVTRLPRFEIFDIPNGNFDVRVGARVGTLSIAWAVSSNRPMGLTAPPSDVAYLSVALQSESLALSWPSVPDRDLSYYYIKYSPIIGASATWSTATDLIFQVVGTSIRVPILPGTFFIKAVDTSGIESVNATSTSSVAVGVGMNAIWTSNQQPGWSGIKTNCAVDTLLLKSTPGVEATYEFESVDLGRPYFSRIVLKMVGSGERPDANMIFWDRLSDLISISNVLPSDYSFRVEMAISLDGVTWGDWSPFAAGDWTGQKFKWKVFLTPNHPLVSAVLLQLAVSIDMPDRVFSGRNVVVSSAGLAVTFSPAFRVPPTIGITGKNFVSGDYFVITGEAETGFYIVIRNSAGTAVSRMIDWIAVGYGYGSI